MTTHSSFESNDSSSHRTRLRPASIDSYHSTLSWESYASSAASASSTFVNARSIYSDVQTETDESGCSIDVQRPETPLDDDDHDVDLDMPFHVLCVYDFDSDDPDHTPFKKNDILQIIAREPSGWWAAQSGDHVGWIPSAYVQVIHPDRLQQLLDESQGPGGYEFEAEALYNGETLTTLSINDEPNFEREQIFFDNEDVQVLTTHSGLLSPRGFPTDVTPGFSRLNFPTDLPSVETHVPGFLNDPWNGMTSSPNVPRTPRTPRTPIPPKVPAPAPSATMSTSASQLHPTSRQLHPTLKLNTTPMMVNKPTPPTPVSTTPLSSHAPTPLSSHVLTPSSSNAATPASNYSYNSFLPRSRSLGSSTVSSSSSSSNRRPDVMMHSPGSLKNLPALVETPSMDTVSSSSSSSRRRQDVMMYSPGSVKNLSALVETPTMLNMESPNEIIIPSPHSSPYSRKTPGNWDKIRRLTGEDDAQAFHNAKTAQAQLPWYLKPDHTGSEINLDHDGTVKAGTLEALVERLTIDPLILEHEKTFRHTFLTTFRSFTTADRALELLIDRYGMDPPIDLAAEQFKDWIEKKFRPTQARVLHVFTLWVEQYGMVEDDSQTVTRLRDFLLLISTPPPHAQSAKNILQLIERQRNSDINIPSLAASAPVRKQTKRIKNDLLRIDHGELARQLTLYEARLYMKVRPHECLTWSSSQKGDNVRNLRAFVSTSDKLAAWVKMSILNNDALGRRADTIELWIKVAEKCRALNNFSSMSAIVAALTSQVIARLQLTWAHVGKASHVDPLVKLSEPTANFAAYRNIFSSVEGACLPYIGIYLSDMVKISETFPDCIKAQSTESTSPTSGPKLVNFIKRQKMCDVAHAILRHQPKVRDLYKISENTPVLEFIETQLRIAAGKDEGSFWMRSQEVQHAEVAHADIRRGLEAAGF